MAEAYNSQSDIPNSVGTINSNGKTELTVTCGNGTILKIEELQLAGKKRMKIKDFLAGFRNPENYKFKVE
jgi:Methionyl-tRNA formyltransferase